LRPFERAHDHDSLDRLDRVVQGLIEPHANLRFFPGEHAHGSPGGLDLGREQRGRDRAVGLRIGDDPADLVHQLPDVPGPGVEDEILQRLVVQR
jgi:hypothetical protein